MKMTSDFATAKFAEVTRMIAEIVVVLVFVKGVCSRSTILHIYIPLTVVAKKGLDRILQ